MMEPEDKGAVARSFNIVLGASAALAFAAALALQALPARASTEPYIGEIQTFAFNFCPRFFAPLLGQLLPINQNQALFSLLGTTYGGNGTTNFALPMGKPLPTLKQGAPLLQCIALTGVYPSRP
jgi:microcystin-dependent protein